MNKTSIGQKMDASLCSGNGDMYSGIGNIWELAHRHNKDSLAKNGQVTSRNPVKRKYRPLPLV